jgi:serine/threonine protein phosphatase PrpC
MLPKPVDSTVIERHSSSNFRVGVAEVNGWRNSMEDAHVIHMNEDSGFFGVFDGHGGDQCANFVARRIQEQIRTKGYPKDDAAFKQLVLGVDKEFLNTKQDSGSTGTMCIVDRSSGAGGKCRLRLANVGDSRVLLGRRDGTIIDGGGTDGGLTTDHKPDLPSEKERIYRTGGHVASGQMGGPARVNGELAVSRCFGDARFKEIGGPRPEDHPVTADPELGRAECNEADFLLVVCDGVSEGDFPNPAVVKFVASRLAATDDPGAAAQAVCHKAIETGSKDNVTCMLVLLKGSGNRNAQKHVDFVPGQLSSVRNEGFMTAYEAMAKKAGLTLAQAAEMRYDMIVESLKTPGITASKAQELRAELEAIGNPVGPKGSADRNTWFQNWEKKLPENMEADESEDEMMRFIMARHGLSGSGGSVGLPSGIKSSGRRVRVGDLITLRSAVDDNPALSWDGRMAQLAGTEGQVQEDDPSDGTSHVFCAGSNMMAWLPTCALIEPDEGPKGRRGSTPTPSAGRKLPPNLPTPARLDQSTRQIPSVDVLSRQRNAGARGSSPSTPSSTGSSMSLSGARLINAPRPPVTASMEASSVKGNRAPPAYSAAGMPSGGRHRTPSPSHRSTSPLDFSSSSRTRGPTGSGRLSRSVPSRPPII